MLSLLVIDLVVVVLLFVVIIIEILVFFRLVNVFCVVFLMGFEIVSSFKSVLFFVRYIMLVFLICKVFVFESRDFEEMFFDFISVVLFSVRCFLLIIFCMFMLLEDLKWLGVDKGSWCWCVLVMIVCVSGCLFFWLRFVVSCKIFVF